MSYNPNNVFAKILRADLPCDFILEDSFFMAFHDLHPKAPIHALVIPKGPYCDVHDFHTHASTDEIIGFYRGVSAVIKHLDLEEKGCRLISNMKEHGQQDVPHYHMHILAGRPLGAKIVAS